MDTPIEKNSREKKEFFFQKTKPKTMLIQHVKGYPDPSMYIKNKGGITLDTDRETPCMCVRSCNATNNFLSVSVQLHWHIIPLAAVAECTQYV